MNYRKLGKSDLQVSEIALGCWGFSGDPMWGPAQDKKSIKTVHVALDAGINLLDTAEAYGNGHSEEVLGKALLGRRQEAIIATKVSPENLVPQKIQRSCEASLRRLRTDYIDVYQIHWPNRQIPADDIMAALDRLKQAGKILACGVSNYGNQDLKEILPHGEIVSNQLPYNLLARAIEYQILPKCIDENVSVLCYSPLLHGLLAGKFASADDVPIERARTRHFSKERPLTRHGGNGCEVETFNALDKIGEIAARLKKPMALLAISWLLHRPGVTSVITGTREPKQIEQIAESSNLQLNPDIVESLDNATQKPKEILGANPDMWLPEEESRYR